MLCVYLIYTIVSKKCEDCAPLFVVSLRKLELHSEVII